MRRINEKQGEYMEKLVKLGCWVGGILILCLTVNQLVYSYYPPYRGYIQSWNADIDREVFEDTKPFVSGTIQELRRYQNQYNLSKDLTEKQTILAAAREIASEIDYNKLPEEIQTWLNTYY